jgi:hypothetical protein
MVNAQEWLDKEYPKKERSKITKLDINSKRLQGYLNLNDFVNLKELNCYKNKLEFLDISNCSELVLIRVEDNQLTNSKISLALRKQNNFSKCYD